MTRIEFDLTLEEPVLVTAPGGDPNTDDSEMYIPGSALRGAIIGRYLAKHSANLPLFFLDGTLAFLNAYPVVPVGEKMIIARPTPLSWRKKKDDTSDPKFINDQFVIKAGNIQKEDIQRKRLAPFVVINGSDVQEHELEYEIAVHNERDRQKGHATEESGQLFRYRSLAAGQTFHGAILINDDPKKNAPPIETIRALLNGTILLGGSQSAGYGLTTIDTSEESEPAPPSQNNEWDIIYLSSDVILRDAQSGQGTTDLLGALGIACTCGKTVCDCLKMASETVWGGGFNKAWGLPLPQEWMLKKGSAYCVRKLSASEKTHVNKAIQQGIGARVAEGYGRIELNPSWYTLKENHYKLTELPDTIQATTVQSNRASHPLLAQMDGRLLERELDKKLMVVAQQIGKGKSRGWLSNSQIGRLRLQVRQNPEDLSPFRNYLEGTTVRKSADDQFRKYGVTVGSKSENFRAWLLQLTDETNEVTVWKVLGMADGHYEGAISQTTIDLKAQTVPYTIRLIDAICEQLAKQGRN